MLRARRGPRARDRDSQRPTPTSRGSAIWAARASGALLNMEQRATELALQKRGRMAMTLSLPQLNAFTLGQLFFLFEAATLFAGALHRVNALDQPAAEEGRRLTFGLAGRKGWEDRAAEVEAWLAGKASAVHRVSDARRRRAGGRRVRVLPPRGRRPDRRRRGGRAAGLGGQGAGRERARRRRAARRDRARAGRQRADRGARRRRGHERRRRRAAPSPRHATSKLQLGRRPRAASPRSAFAARRWPASRRCRARR